MNNYTSWMIVFEKNKLRLDNYNKVNNIFGGCNKFSAIDTLSEKNFIKEFSIKDNNDRYTTDKFKSKFDRTGQLGCKLSHQKLIEHIYKNSPTYWNLVLEDDISAEDLEKINIDEIYKILSKATENGSNYIQLYSHPRFEDKQVKQKKIYDNLYEMINQWGTVAYFISKDGCKILIDKYPFDDHIDFVYCRYIKELKSLCWLNKIFETQGDISSMEKNDKFKSLIWNSEKLKLT